MSWIKRSTLIASVAYLLIIFVTLALIEGLLFFLEPKTLTQEETTSSDVVLRSIPSYWEDHDIYGFPNSKFGKANVLVTGDSHTYGTSAPKGKNWPIQFSEISNLSVYNMSTGGNGFSAYYYWIQRYFKDVKPELIVVSFYNGNDFHDVAESVYNKPYWVNFRKKENDFTFLKMGELSPTRDKTNYVKNLVLSTRIGTQILAPLYREIKAKYREIKAKYREIKAKYRENKAKVYRVLPFPELSDPKFLGDGYFSQWSHDEPMTCQFPYRKMVTDISSDVVKEGLRLSKLFVEKIIEIGKQHSIPIVFVSIPQNAVLWIDFL